ncbi:MAG TPA: CoA-acylating methylmalonate-semialdehyde dehydrogenase [Polyangiales bacterium]|nr:CoA-acylating methylmalonate-semialdehyde dehydrogenase [Polyangiales bacterium]
MPPDDSPSTFERLVDLPERPYVGANFVAGAHKPRAPDRDQKLIEVHSPYTGQLLGTVPDTTAAELDEIVQVAKAAAADWGHWSLKERTAPLFRFRALLFEHIEALSHSVAAESGKTLAEARAGVEKGIEVVEYALSLQNLEQGASLEVSRGVRCELRREPLGVVAGITPFNFPAMVPMWMFPIAVTLGNAFILKPSEKVPFTALRLAELMHDAGYPPGVFSVVHGGIDTVHALIDHPDVAAYAFVGSSKVAASVYTRAAERGKRVLALGGAKNALILLPDADPQLAIPGVVASFTGCAGQRCMAGSLLIAVGDCERLIEAISQQAASVRLGPDMGAIINSAARARLVAAIEQARADGAHVLLDGRIQQPPAAYAQGSWLGPTILDEVAPNTAAATDELFGPVLSVVRVANLREALALEAKSPYGNATSVFTQSGAHARFVSDHAQSGMIGVNVGVPVPREPFSFGGTKASRYGHGDITGAGGVELWTKLKKVTSKWGKSDGSWMS